MAKTFDLESYLAHLPSKPGVYRFWDKTNTLLYVGKAKNLKNRVSTYFQASKGHTPRIQKMVNRITHIDTIITSNEMEALLLEANLIQELKPKFNILMRDDKRYPWLALTHEPFPRLIVTRKPGKQFRRCFGPYPSVNAMYETLRLTKTLFPLRQRRRPLFKDRPCMNYHIGQCLAPCVNWVSEPDYEVMVDQLTRFLRGDTGDILTELKQQMMEASDAMAFEKAARLRDRYNAIETVLQHQRVLVDDDDAHWDVLGVAISDTVALTCLVKIRHGKLIQTHYFQQSLPTETAPEAVLTQLIQQFYNLQESDDLPSTLLLPMDVDDRELLSDWLSEKKGRRVKLVTPQKKKAYKTDLVELAQANANEGLQQALFEDKARIQRDPAKALHELQQALKLTQYPKRMECFDISHISGTHTVASMVVFEDGRPAKSDYRRFEIKTTDDGVPNDFQSMREVISRRFSAKNIARWGQPDLLIIDGGKGQLSSAGDALSNTAISNQAIISLAKKFEEVFLPDQSRPIVLERNSDALKLLQHIRDEAHRFAVTFHRQKRNTAQTQSQWDEIPGLGTKRKERLKTHFKTIQALLAATPDEIANISQTTGKTVEKLYNAIQALRPEN